MAIEYLSTINYWHWIAFGLVLIAFELLGTAGYFLWMGLSAIVVGVILACIPISWQLQWVSFASFSLITTWLWWRKQKTQDEISDDHRTLNQRDKQLVGRVLILEENIVLGKNRLRIGDTTWSAISNVELKQGTSVKITNIEGITLTIEQVTSSGD